MIESQELVSLSSVENCVLNKVENSSILVKNIEIEKVPKNNNIMKILNNENNPRGNNIKYDSEERKSTTTITTNSSSSSSNTPMTSSSSSLRSSSSTSISTSNYSKRKARASILLPFLDDLETPPTSPLSDYDNDNKHNENTHIHSNTNGSKNEILTNSTSRSRLNSRRITLSPSTARFLMLEVIAEEAAAAVAVAGVVPLSILSSTTYISPKKIQKQRQDSINEVKCKQKEEDQEEEVELHSLINKSPIIKTISLNIMINTDTQSPSPALLNSNERCEINSKFSPLSNEMTENPPVSLSNKSTPSTHKTHLSPYRSPSQSLSTNTVSNFFFHSNHERDDDEEDDEGSNSMEITRENLNNSYFHGTDLFPDAITGLPDLLLERDHVPIILHSNEANTCTDMESSKIKNWSMNERIRSNEEITDICTKYPVLSSDVVKEEVLEKSDLAVLESEIDENLANNPIILKVAQEGKEKMKEIIVKTLNMDDFEIVKLNKFSHTPILISNFSSIENESESNSDTDILNSKNQILENVIEKHENEKEISLHSDKNKMTTVGDDHTYIENKIRNKIIVKGIKEGYNKSQSNLILNNNKNDKINETDIEDDTQITEIDRKNNINTYDTGRTYIDELNALLDTTSDSDVSCSTTSSVQISTSFPNSTSPSTMESGSSSSPLSCTDISCPLRSLVTNCEENLINMDGVKDKIFLKDEKHISIAANSDENCDTFDFLFSDEIINEENDNGKNIRILCDIQTEESEHGRHLLLNSFYNSENKEHTKENDIVINSEEDFKVDKKDDEGIIVENNNVISTSNFICVDNIVNKDSSGTFLQNPKESLNCMDIVDMDNEEERSSEKALVRRRDVLSPERQSFGKKSKVEKHYNENEDEITDIIEDNLHENSKVTNAAINSENRKLFCNFSSGDLGTDSEENFVTVENEHKIVCDKRMNNTIIYADRNLSSNIEISKLASTNSPQQYVPTNSECVENTKLVFLDTMVDEEWEKRALARLTIRNEIAKWKYFWEMASYGAAKFAREKTLRKT